MKLYQFNNDMLIDKSELIYHIQCEMPTEYHSIAFKMLNIIDTGIEKEKIMKECDILVFCDNAIPFFSDKLKQPKSIIKSIFNFFISFGFVKIVDKSITELLNTDIDQIEDSDYGINVTAHGSNKKRKSAACNYHKSYIINSDFLSDEPALAVKSMMEIMENTSGLEQKFAVHMVKDITKSYLSFRMACEEMPECKEHIHVGFEIGSNDLENFTLQAVVLNQFVEKKIIIENCEETNENNKSFTRILKL